MTSVFVWTLSDVIGLLVLALALLAVTGIWLIDKWNLYQFKKEKDKK